MSKSVKEEGSGASLEIKASDLELIVKVSMQGGVRFDNAMRAKMQRAISRWKELVLFKREEDKKRAGEAAAEKAFRVLRTSTRKNRTLQEIEYLRHFFIKTMGNEIQNPWGGTSPPTIPYKQMSAEDMDQLCNEVDYIEYSGKSLIFLQGDFGNCYYMIARGEVGLYMEPSKDKEMSLASEYARYRAKPLPETLTDMAVFGKYLVSLPAGRGFGEAAILKATNKFRNSTCVTNVEGTILMVLHLDTYNDILRRHHFRHLKTKFTVELLSQLPLLAGFAQSVIASIAYTMKSQLYSLRACIVRANQPIKNILLVASGEIKALPAEADGVNSSGSKSKASNTKKISAVNKGSADWLVAQLAKRTPQLAVAYLGHGHIIGESEMHKGLTHFELTYIVSSAECEILEIPLDVYKKYIIPPERRKTQEYKLIKEVCCQREENHNSRRVRAHAAIDSMLSTRRRNEIQEKQLHTVLPLCSNASPRRHSVVGSGFSGSLDSMNKSLNLLEIDDGELVELDNAMLEYVYGELQGYFPGGFVPNEIPKKVFFDALQKRLSSPSTTRRSLMEQSARQSPRANIVTPDRTLGTPTAGGRVTWSATESQGLTPTAPTLPPSTGSKTYNTLSPRSKLPHPRILSFQTPSDKEEDFRVVEPTIPVGNRTPTTARKAAKV